MSKSWQNPDFVPITLHSYRARWEEAKPALSGKKLEMKVKSTKTLTLPTLFIQGEADGVNPPYISEDAGQKFTGPFRRIVMPRSRTFCLRVKSHKKRANICSSCWMVSYSLAKFYLKSLRHWRGKEVNLPTMMVSVP